MKKERSADNMKKKEDSGMSTGGGETWFKKTGHFSRRGGEIKGTEGGDKYLNGP